MHGRRARCILSASLGWMCTRRRLPLRWPMEVVRERFGRRDAVMLARLHRAGELTGVWVPDAAHEAMRDLVRARATAMKVLSKARQHLGVSCDTGGSIPAFGTGPKLIDAG